VAKQYQQFIIFAVTALCPAKWRHWTDILHTTNRLSYGTTPPTVSAPRTNLAQNLFLRKIFKFVATRCRIL